MARHAVTRVRGDGWDPARGMREQDDWPQHAAFMDALAADGFVLLGGPVGDDGEILLIVDGENEEQIRARLDADPWVPLDLLRVARIAPWEILLSHDGSPPAPVEP